MHPKKLKTRIDEVERRFRLQPPQFGNGRGGEVNAPRQGGAVD